MSSNEKKSAIDARIIGHESNTEQEIVCFVCIILLVLLTIVGGGNYLGVSDPVAAIAALLLTGLPALILAILYVGLQVREIVLSEN